MPERAGSPLPVNTWFVPDFVTLNTGLRMTTPCTATFCFAFHEPAVVSTHGGIVTGGPPVGAPPQRYSEPTLGALDAMPVPSGSAAVLSDVFGMPTV